MASSPLTPIVSGFPLTTAWQVLYTLGTPNLRLGIDAAVFNNYSTNNVEYSVRLSQDGTGEQVDEVISNSKIRASGNSLATGMIGQAIGLGGTIEAKASANNSIAVAITATIVNT
jgi:hypothetical protein